METETQTQFWTFGRVRLYRSPIASKMKIESTKITLAQSSTAVVALLRAFKGQTLAKRVRLLGESTESYGKPAVTRVSLVRRWTSKLGRCLTRPFKRSCSEATTKKTISDKSSTGNVRGVPQRNNEVEVKE